MNVGRSLVELSQIAVLRGDGHFSRFKSSRYMSIC